MSFDVEHLPATLDVAVGVDDAVTLPVSVVDGDGSAVDISGWQLEGQECSVDVTDAAQGELGLTFTVQSEIRQAHWWLRRTSSPARLLVSGRLRATTSGGSDPAAGSTVELAISDATVSVELGDAIDTQARADLQAHIDGHPSGGGSSLSDDDPAALGSAAAGTGDEASRDDHVHPMPSAAAVGAAEDDHDHGHGDLSGVGADDHHDRDHAGRHAAGQPDAVAPGDIGAEATANKGQAGGYASLNAEGRVPSAQIPPVALSEPFVVADESAMLALDAQAGDVAIRTDQGRSYILARDGDPSVLADWLQLHVPEDPPVDSVNGETGTVELDAGDVGAPTTAAFEDHNARHESGGADEIDVTDLGGELADPQPTKAHDLGGSEHNADTLAALNTKVSDATLDDSSDTRDPTEHGDGAHSETYTKPGDDADTLGSGAASDGQVLTADGSSGAAWEDPAVAADDLTKLDVNTETSSYTLVLADAGGTVEMDVATANDLTVPPNSGVAFDVGTVIEVCQVGSGTTTIVEGSGVTVQVPDSLSLDLRGQWSTVSLRKRATDQWVVAGDLAESS